MPQGSRRTRVLHGIGSARGRVHRYTWVRWAIAVVSTVGIALLPLTNTLRLDLWGGNHHWLGEPVGLVQAMKAFAFPFLAVNVAIVLTSRFLGRWLCGFVCPVGNMNRLTEWFRWRFRKSAAGAVSPVVIFASCFLLAAITFSFWVDWRVFLEGSTMARSVSGAFLGGTTLGFFAITYGMGQRFCHQLCPSGVYFAVLGPESHTGVRFDHPEACTECKACERVCPVDLHPRTMSGQHMPESGFYPAGLTDFARCLRCGDCVVVCESTKEDPNGPTPLGLGFVKPKAPEEVGA